MRTITLEEHFATPGFLDGPGGGNERPSVEIQQQSRHQAHRAAVRRWRQEARGDGCRAHRHASPIADLPGTEQLEAAETTVLARDTNDYLADAIKKHPARLSGFASLPTAAPDKAAQELERRVGEQKFVGAAINGHNRGRYLDDKFLPILECAEKLEPLFISTSTAAKAGHRGVIQRPWITRNADAGGPGWGWHIETAVHIIRLILGGVFDRFPNCRSVSATWAKSSLHVPTDGNYAPEGNGLQRPVSAYLRENVHHTFSGFNFRRYYLTTA